MQSSREADSRKDSAPLAPGLYIVSTPIGNLGDLSPRARRVLAGVDLIACEDTRVTARLVAACRAETPMQPYHEHNAARMRPRLLARLASGARVALVSDAGTPLVSDPGLKLVQAAIDAGCAVTVVPGPNAALSALVLSGLPSDRFLFAGFLPTKAVARRAALQELAPVKATLVLYESPARLADSLADMASVLGDRPAAVARELTKLYEEVRRGALPELAAHYAAIAPPKGEVTLVIGPPGDDAPVVNDAALDARLDAALAAHSLKDAVARVAAETGIPRRAVYLRALARKSPG